MLPKIRPDGMHVIKADCVLLNGQVDGPEHKEDTH